MLNKFHTAREQVVFFFYRSRQIQPNYPCIVPVPYMDPLRKIRFFQPRMNVIGLEKCMTTIPGLLTIFKKISNLVNVLV